MDPAAPYHKTRVLSEYERRYPLEPTAPRPIFQVLRDRPRPAGDNAWEHSLVVPESRDGVPRH